MDGPGPGEVLVKVKAAGLCHSDLSVINGNRPRPMPMALGHEAAGIVEEVGPSEGGGEPDLQPGDHVVFVFVPSCGHCEPCTEGRPALCEPGAAANGAGTLLSGARRLHREDGSDVNHHLGVSGFAEYRAATGGGVEFAFDFTGSTRALDLGYRITRRGGTTVTAGLPAPSATMPLAPVTLVAEERTLKGSYIGTAVPTRDIPRYIALYRQGRLPVDRLLTGTIELDDINEGFDRLHDGQAIRQVIDLDSRILGGTGQTVAREVRGPGGAGTEELVQPGRGRRDAGRCRGRGRADRRLGVHGHVAVVDALGDSLVGATDERRSTPESRVPA